MYFIRWAGGKQGIIKKIIDYLPESMERTRLIEPFAGAASMFFNVDVKDALLIDSNKNLINCYEQIKRNPQAVNKYLKKLKNNHSKDNYYQTRESYNKSIEKTNIIQAARFIYLVQSSFNGIYRVNKQGKYNVPFGKENPCIPSLENLKQISKKLESTNLIADDFSIVLNHASHTDFVYFDPPYFPLNNTSYFQHYTKDRFTSEQQVKLFEVTEKLTKKGVKILISNSDTVFIRKLFSKWRINEIGVTRYISCKKNKERVSEILISNY